MKTMIRLSFVMALYATVACVGLSFVYIATAPRIAAAEGEAVKSALGEIFPEASDFIDVTGKLESGSDSIVFDRAYVAMAGSAVSGMVLQVTGPTYNSSTMLVAVDMARRIQAVRFLSNLDTPGLGTKTAESPFIDQFFSKSVDDGFATGSDVVAISGATISSKAVSNILRLAGFEGSEYLALNYGGLSGSGKAPSVAELAPMPLDASLADLFPGAEFSDVTGKVANTVERSVVFTGAWLAKKDGKAIGVAVQAKGQTYKASTILVGVKLDRTLAGVRINETSDSKKYGFTMVSPEFYGTFTGKPVDDPYLVGKATEGGDVDAISGSTISTMGVANMAKVAGYEGAVYLASLSAGKKGPPAASPFVLNVIPEEE